jgi:hypothetical protein
MKGLNRTRPWVLQTTICRGPTHTEDQTHQDPVNRFAQTSASASRGGLRNRLDQMRRPTSFGRLLQQGSPGFHQTQREGQRQFPDTPSVPFRNGIARPRARKRPGGATVKSCLTLPCHKDFPRKGPVCIGWATKSGTWPFPTVATVERCELKRDFGEGRPWAAQRC